MVANRWRVRRAVPRSSFLARLCPICALFFSLIHRATSHVLFLYVGVFARKKGKRVRSVQEDGNPGGQKVKLPGHTVSPRLHVHLSSVAGTFGLSSHHHLSRHHRIGHLGRRRQQQADERQRHRQHGGTSQPNPKTSAAAAASVVEGCDSCPAFISSTIADSHSAV